MNLGSSGRPFRLLRSPPSRSWGCLATNGPTLVMCSFVHASLHSIGGNGYTTSLILSWSSLLILPFALVPPWQLRQSESVLALGGRLRELWKVEEQDDRPLLRELCALPGCWKACKQVLCGVCYISHALDRFPRHEPTDKEGFSWKPEEEKLRYTRGRDGDFLLTPFQCDLCVFHNVQLRDPVGGSLQDVMLLCCIRRINLDAVWGESPPR